VLFLREATLIALYTAAYCLYLRFRVGQEEAVLSKHFGVEFRRYCRQVRRFIPRLTPYAGSPVLYFNRKLFVKNHGGWNTLAMAAFYAVVAARIWIL
jgi:hypothetical protein